MNSSDSYEFDRTHKDVNESSRREGAAWALRDAVENAKRTAGSNPTILKKYGMARN